MDQQQAPAEPSTDQPEHEGEDGPVETSPSTAEVLDAATVEVEDVELDPEVRAEADGRTPGALLVALEAAEAEAAERLDDAQRARAELKNVKRRTADEVARAGQVGAGHLLSQLLDAIDDLDRTFAAASAVSDDTDGLASGVQAVHKKLHDVLRANGVERVDAVDVPFDANLHDAVQQLAADEPLDEPVVAEVYRPGYLLRGRVLRAAMVVVRQ